jgi:hypothetical protein
MDDDVLIERFDRLVRMSGPAAPSMAELEGRVVARGVRRRRNQRRAALAGVAAVLAIVGLLGVLLAPSSEPALDVATDPTPTALPVDEAADPVFTIGAVPDALAFRACDALPAPEDPDAVVGVVCTFDDPATTAADGLRITRLIEGATPEVLAAWDAGDGPGAAAAAGGTETPDDAEFRTVGDARVLDLTPGGQPSSEASAALQLLVGDDLVDIGTTNVSLAELDQLVAGLAMAPPSTIVSQALGALPEGSQALVQGPRPLWVQTDPLTPGNESPFGGETVGAELAIPGTDGLVGVDVTSGIDADALLDSLLDEADPALTEAEIGGRRAVVLEPGGMMPIFLPEPRPGPQALVRLGESMVVRIKDPDGSAELVRSVAEAFQ